MAEGYGKDSHVLTEFNGEAGEVRISEEVIAVIAGIAATEVEGVDSMCGNITREIVGRLGMKSLSKGVRIEVNEGVVSVELKLNINYNYNIPDVSKQVQERVCEKIEGMTGLEVSDVSVKIAGINVE